MSRHEFAFRFKPSSGSNLVRSDCYLRALDAALEGIASMRAAFAPSLAAKHGWPAKRIRDALVYSIGPHERGSLVVPVVPGATDAGPTLAVDAIALDFWKQAATELSDVSSRRAERLTASGADAFARASAAARESSAQFGMVIRSGPRGNWRSVANLTELEPGLRKFAAARLVGAGSVVTLLGQIVAITFEPPAFVLATRDRKHSIKMPSSLREAAHASWGQEVKVTAEAVVGFEGDVGVARAIAIEPVARGTEREPSFGALREVWDTPEAQKYLDHLRQQTD